MRLRIITAVFFIFSIGLGVRLFHLQIMGQDRFEVQAASERSFERILQAERGVIIVHDGEREEYTIATNAVRYTVTADPRLVKDPVASVRRLAAVLGADEAGRAVWEQKLARVDDPYEVIARYVDESSAQAVRSLRLSGILLEKEIVRYYPDGALFAPLTGFVAYKADGAPGQYGIEGAIDGVLRGQSGRIEGFRDAVGRLIATSRPEFRRAEPGSSVALAIDRPTQYTVCKKLQEAVDRHQAAGGSAIVVHPHTGKIKALCSAPEYDPNSYHAVSDIGVFQNNALLEYEPGSVFKPLTMAAALDAGVVNPKTTYEDTGVLTIGKHTIRNYGNKSYGVQTMVNVLERSLNTGAVFAAQSLGHGLFSQYVRWFGFGKRTDIPMAGEQSGSIHLVDKPGDIYLATASFGQGLTVTPLQLAMAFSAIANGGVLMEPLLVERIIPSKGEPIVMAPREIRRVITEQSAETLRAMLISVVRNGFSKAAGVDGYYIGGKTGTAQMPDGKGGYGADTIHTFAGMAPGDKPEFVLVIQLIKPQIAKEASQTVAPLFGVIAGELLDLYGIPRQNGSSGF